MTRYGQIGWRIAAAVAFAGTAALAVILTHVPVRPDATLSSVFAVRSCLTSGLEAWLGLGGTGGTGGGTQVAGTYYTLEFTNVSHRACSLYGYPEVSAYATGRVTGSQIGSTVARDTSVMPRTVTLAPGATAHAVLRVVVTSAAHPATCALVTVEELRVTLPSQGRPAFVPAHIPMCTGNGRASLSVQAIQARPGVPGYAMLP